MSDAKVAVYTLDQIRQAFRDRFYMSGEIWFGQYPNKEAEELLSEEWKRFLKSLKKIDGEQQ